MNKPSDSASNETRIAQIKCRLEKATAELRLIGQVDGVSDFEGNDIRAKVTERLEDEIKILTAELLDIVGYDS